MLGVLVVWCFCFGFDALDCGLFCCYWLALISLVVSGCLFVDLLLIVCCY